MKGNSSCHTFTKSGAANYDQIEWSNEGCQFKKSIGKGRFVCMKNDARDCLESQCTLKDQK